MGQVIVRNELNWNWDERPPFVFCGRSSKYMMQLAVDPAPGYAHELRLVETVLAHCERSFPLPNAPVIYLLDREGMSRTNGQTYHDSNWDRKNEWDEYESLPWIVLYGKRIPLHPAVTRYLTAHEYGHCVDRAIANKKFHGSDPSNNLRTAYAKLRGGENPAHYGPGAWHLAPAELFADDFRILVAKVETEFWPHPGVKRPEEMPNVQDWWKEALTWDLKPGVFVPSLEKATDPL